MSVSNIKTTVEAVVMPYIVALDTKYKSTLPKIQIKIYSFLLIFIIFCNEILFPFFPKKLNSLMLFE